MNETISLRFAKLISSIFHPLLMPTYGMIAIFNSNTYLEFSLPTKLQWIIVGMVFFCTFLLPFFYTLFLLKQGKVMSIHMDTKEERVLPLLFTTLIYFSSTYLVQQIGLSYIINYLFIGGTLAITIAFLTNLFWKISAHMVGVGGFVGAIIGVSFRMNLGITYLLIIYVLIAGLVAFARLRMNSHNPAQIYAGFALGFLSELLLLVFL